MSRIILGVCDACGGWVYSRESISMDLQFPKCANCGRVPKLPMLDSDKNHKAYKSPSWELEKERRQSQ